MKLALALSFVLTQNMTIKVFDSPFGNLYGELPSALLVDFNNITSFTNIKNLALLSSNAYYDPNDTDWKHPPNDTQNTDYPTDLSNSTVVAYLFSDHTLTNHVISIKGTTTKFDLQNDGDTVQNDKFNDNLYFSCCFYKQSKLFDDYISQSNCSISPTTKKVCSAECYKESLKYHENYKLTIDNILNTLHKTIHVNSSNIIVTGHSLGGVLATFLGLAINKPVVTFESPGELYYLLNSNMFDKKTLSKRTNIYHFGHTADTVFTGKCKGIFSTCFWGGYVIRTTCHVGHTCSYDSVSKLGVRESVLTHRLNWVIKNVIPHWEYDFPNCTLDTTCTDCDHWTMS